MSSPGAMFLDERRMMNGPWRAFERDVARLLLMRGFEDVRIVDGSGDHGGDILAVRDGQLWVLQSKFTSNSAPPSCAISEVVEAGQFYAADNLVVVCSRPAGGGIRQESERYRRMGFDVKIWGPAELLQASRCAPEYAPNRRVLHEYQLNAAEALRSSLLEVGRGQLVLATGLGKTVIMAETVADMLRTGMIPDNRVFVLAHTRELIDQLQRAFWLQLPRWVSTHRLDGNEKPAYWDGITFATVQSIANIAERIPRPGLVMVDEAHHLGSPTYRLALERLNPQMVAGVTATPWRGDEYDIDQILGVALTKLGIADGLSKGFLCEVDYRLMADNLDWSLVQTRSQFGYSLPELNRRLILPTRDEEAARIILETFSSCKRHAGVLFSPTVDHAEFMAAMLRQFGLRAESISAQLSLRDREKLMTGFRRGRLDVMTTVDLFNEGIDVPDVDLVVFMRATHSRRIFVQQLGRGLRTSAGKDKVVVLDFVTDLRRVAEVLELEKAVKSDSVEHLGLGDRVVQFRDASAGNFLSEWIRDQADLILREGDPHLELPILNFPPIPHPGGVE